MAYTSDDFEAAERHVEHGERFVSFQRTIVRLKKDSGSPNVEAEAWLLFFEAGLAKHVAMRDEIAFEMATRSV